MPSYMRNARMAFRVGCLGLLASACSQRAYFLGYDLTTGEVDGPTDTTSAPPVVEAGVTTDAGVGTTSGELDASMVSQTTDTTHGSQSPDGGLVSVVLNDPPNVLVDVLGIEPDRVVQRTNNIFEQLFFGDPATESIFVDQPEGAYIFDVFHDDTRMDAMGYAMLVLPHFDRQVEFDKLWTTIDTKFRYTSGARSGYFHQSCATDFSACSDDIDTFGVYYVVTALFIAQSRWGGSTYLQAAQDILTTMRSKEQNGIVEGVLNLFDEDGLPRRRPFEGEAPDYWSGSLMPAFFELWYFYTSDLFWHRAAVQSRALLQLVAHPETGLAPERVDRTGKPTQEMPAFREGCFGVGFQMALDHAWIAPQAQYIASADLLVGFFGSKGPGYPAAWSIEGDALNEVSSGALVALNGAAASIATLDPREAMMRAAWEMATPTGSIRYYDGMSQLLSLMFLGGQLKPQ